MTILKETVYIDRDNTIRLALYEDSSLLKTAYPSLVPTRWILTIDTGTPIVVDSNTSPGAFNWDGTNSVIELALSGEIVSGFATYTGTTLVMYSTEFPNGVVLLHPDYSHDKLKINAVAGA